MGKISNFFRFKSIKSVNKGSLCVGEYRNKNKGKALLFRDKVVQTDLEFVSENLNNYDDYMSDEFIYCIKKSKIASREPMIICNRQGVNLTPYGLYVGDDEDERFCITEIHDNNIYFIKDNLRNTRFLIFKKEQVITEPYSKIGELDNGERKVSLYTGESYYITESGVRNSVKFVEESEKDENGSAILTIKVDCLLKKILNDKKHFIASMLCENITRFGNFYLLETCKGERYFIDSAGKRMSEHVEEFYALNNGVKLIREITSEKFKILNPNMEVVSEIENPIVNTQAGLVVGDLKGKTVLMGYDTSKVYSVDENVAKLFMSKISGERLSSSIINNVLNSDIDVNKTLKMFERVLKLNAKIEVENKELEILSLKCGAIFKQAIEESAKRRVKRISPNLTEKEELEMMKTLYPGVKSLHEDKKQQYVYVEMKVSRNRKRKRKNNVSNDDEDQKGE